MRQPDNRPNGQVTSAPSGALAMQSCLGLRRQLELGVSMVRSHRVLVSCGIAPGFALLVGMAMGCSASPADGSGLDDGSDESALVTAATAYCPAGATYDATYRLCVTATEALGPFSPAMVASCVAEGGGNEACPGTRWAVSFAKSLRGTAQCPPGTALDGRIGYCATGADVYGPFTLKHVEACKAKGGGAACESQRWARSMVPEGASYAAYPYFYQYNNANEPGATCGITSAAMLLKYWGKGVTPDTLYNRFGKAKGQSPPGLESLYASYGLYTASTYAGTEAMLKRQLDAGRPVVVHGDFTGSGHIMLVIGYTGDGFVVNDPAGLWAGCRGCGYPNRTSTNGRAALYGFAAMRSAMYGEGSMWMSTADTKPFSL